jgi:membrane protease YdiL (CAAX protease family)
MCWFRFGRISIAAVVATIGVMSLTTLALVIYQNTAQPDVRGYGAVLPLHALGGVVTAGIVFTIVNATLEELVFRGVLFDAVQSQWGAAVTVIATALLFGIGHVRGYPPGPLGAYFAALFGLVLGGLRLWTDGLALPIVAHMGADATIYAILVHSGAL